MARSTPENKKMTPQIQIFLYFNGFVVLLLVVYMLFWRARSAPSRLKLSATTSKRTMPMPQRPAVEAQTPKPKERQLNVYFQFNGHDFDAHEVLGVVAGSSLASIEKTFRTLLSSSPEDTHEFYRKAFEAVRAALK